jgi:hypothetical protein
MNKPNPPSSLEKRVVTVLTGNGNLASAAELTELIRETEVFVQASLDVAEAERIRSLDLVQCPDPGEAHQRIVAARLSAERFSASLPKLRDKLSTALAAETNDRWSADYRKVEQKLNAAVTAFEGFSQHAEAIAQMFALAEQVDRAVSDLNGRAPDNEHRRLRSVELTARGMSGFTRDNPSLASTTALPDWDHSARTVWPPRPSTTLAVMAAGMTVPHPGPAWSTPEVQAQRRAEAEKENAQMAVYHDQAAKDEQDRINRQEVERFRQAHPQQR